MLKPKVLMVNIGFIPDSVGGSEFYTYNLSKSLQQCGYEVSIFTALADMRVKRYKILRTVTDGLKVIKVANSHFHARSFQEHFIDHQIDNLFKEVVDEEKPDLIHFQHVAYLSGNLLEIAYHLNIPSIFTLHDYWYICFRSRLLRPGCGICAGPENGARCATCVDHATAHPMAVSNYPLLIKLMHQPVLKRLIINVLDKIPQSFISQARTVLFEGPKQNQNPQATSLPLMAENKFRFEYFKRQLQYPKFVLSPSQHLKRRYEAEGYRDILVLPLGYHQPARVNPLCFKGKLKIAFIGNIERHKGVTVLLNELLKIQPDRIEINIHGRAKDPTYYSEAKRAARQYPPGMVKFHGGYRSDQDLPHIFSQNHLLIFPSIWEENAPLVVREAILHGLAVVGSKLGGVPEVIEDGVNGFLFDPFIKGDLLEIIRHILTEPDTLKRITQGARDTQIESMADHVKKLTNLYDRALNNY
jgi:glycosyltransferase involved in cell wall biosynthesis